MFFCIPETIESYEMPHEKSDRFLFIRELILNGFKLGANNSTTFNTITLLIIQYKTLEMRSPFFWTNDFGLIGEKPLSSFKTISELLDVIFLTNPF